MIMMLLISHNIHASIFGPDNRVETKDASLQAQRLGSSAPALIQEKKIKNLGGGYFQLAGTPMKEMGLCAEEKFSDEQQIATCSGSLIAKNKVLTAAHCFNESFPCEKYRIVFDYTKSGNLKLRDNQIYKCKKILHSKFDMFGEDLAVIELDRDVTDREIISIDTKYRPIVGESLSMIGYPLGISQKAVEEGEVTKVNKKEVSFRHNLDSFSVNSGSPIFNQTGTQIGVLVRGTGANLVNHENKKCQVWHVEKGDGFAEANDLSPLKNKF